ncbi:hypothetical protein KFL_002360050 [Klebsormidium nitens]|uniref:EGF-like domain-containing protein n=1 Tax=Klebsormidium nitens TaxID=105231 RepID=A0A0U9HK68_KLENI|nr:hypothetical protein KFL_002360050 [Klebsormidium nitens]|eukprot:GAQ85452.1 hypothetical protein KFL_002360050 [Klebsormidium nitens]
MGCVRAISFRVRLSLLLAAQCAAFVLLFASVALAQTTSLSQLEQQLEGAPNYSKFLQVLRTDDVVSSVLGPGGSLDNKTIFAFDNAADTPRWDYNLTLVQCGLNDPTHGALRAVLAFNIIEGKYTFAQLQALTKGQTFFAPTAGYVRIIDSASLGEIVDPDLVDDPTLSVHGVNSIDYFRYPAAPDGLVITCTSQANPCYGYPANPCVSQDRNALCQNPEFGVAVCVCSPGFTGTPCVPVSGPVSPPTGDQGVCGTGAAAAFPTRCHFNNDPQGRYVCCDQSGCNGFNPPDNLFPHCANNGYVPPGYGISSSGGPPPSPSPPPSGNQGVCGTGAAAAFPTRCYFNSDPQGRYVCCDQLGCDGFNPPDNLFPHCANKGYVPPGYGVSGGTPVPNPGPPTATGDQGVCGIGAASVFPVRCWYNNDPQGRYVCCNNQGCDGFNPPDYVLPHCKNNGYVPPGI